jgi:hypothetical protein
MFRWPTAETYLMKKTLLTGIAALFLATGAAHAPAEESKVPVLVFGFGRGSCASWSKDQMQGDVWILGFWSGMNAAYTATTGENTEGPGILAEVRKVCQGKPSLSLSEASLQVYDRFQQIRSAQ